MARGTVWALTLLLGCCCCRVRVLCRYILVYPAGCDVCNHLSLFLCVADYDKLLPGDGRDPAAGAVGRQAGSGAGAMHGAGPATSSSSPSIKQVPCCCPVAGWSHFAQFTIAVVNKDPKKSKYSGADAAAVVGSSSSLMKEALSSTTHLYSMIRNSAHGSGTAAVVWQPCRPAHTHNRKRVKRQPLGQPAGPASDPVRGAVAARAASCFCRHAAPLLQEGA